MSCTESAASIRGSNFPLTDSNILERSGKILNLDIPELIVTYLPRSSVDPKRPKQIVDDIREVIQFIGSEYGKDTSLVLTGDLVHYGEKYGSIVTSDDPVKMINRSIDEGLKQVYEEKDFIGYLERSFETMNDQWAPAIATSMLLGDGLAFQIVSQDISDYSEVLQENPPCLVASTFYGVYPHH